MKRIYYMRSKIVPWKDTNPEIDPSTKSYGLCEVFKTRMDFERAYPDEIFIEIEGDK